MHRRSIHVQSRSSFNKRSMRSSYLSGFSLRFQRLSRAHGQVPYVLLTRSPLTSKKQAFLPSVRLACIRHAASVHPEPGSNSPFDCLFSSFLTLCFQASFLFLSGRLASFSWIDVSCLVFKDRSQLLAVCSVILPSASLLCQQLFYLFSVFFFFSLPLLLSLKKSDQASLISLLFLFIYSSFLYGK